MEGITDQMGQIHSKYSKDFAQAWAGIKKTDKEIKKVEKKEKEANREMGWAKFLVDAGLFVVMAVGVVSDFLDGGLSTPLVLMAGSALFSVSDITEDATQGISGDEDGFNPIRDGILKNIPDLGKNADTAYSVLDFASGVVGGKDAYDDLIKEGITVSAKEDSRALLRPVLSANAKNVTSSILKAYGKETLRQAGKTAVDNAVAPLAGQAAGDVTYAVTGNQFAADVANQAASKAGVSHYGGSIIDNIKSGRGANETISRGISDGNSDYQKALNFIPDRINQSINNSIQETANNAAKNFSNILNNQAKTTSFINRKAS
jgi:hypothetical protein